MEKVAGRLIWLVGWAVDDDVLVKVVCATDSHGVTGELCIDRWTNPPPSVVQKNEATCCCFRDLVHTDDS